MTDLVGEAFVRITADTTAMRQAIRRAGDADGKAYAKSFNKRVDEAGDDMIRKTRQRLAAGLVDPKVFDRWAKEFDSVEDAAQKFREALDDINASSKFGAARQNQYTKALKDWEVSAVSARKAAFDLMEQKKADAEATKAQTRQLKNFFALQNEGYTQLQKTLRINEVVLRGHQSRWDAWRNTAVSGVDRVDRRMGVFNFSIGKMFGKGSRNNFFNAMGSLAQGLTTLFTTVPVRVFDGLVKGVDKFFDAFSAARLANFGKFASIGQGILGVFGGKGGLVGAIVGTGVALVAFGKVLPGLVALMSLLGGAATALVGSIGIGLTGALLALIPATIGAVAGIGALGGAFVQFFKDKDNKKFVEDFFQPFKDMNKTYYPEIKTFLTNIRGGFDDLIKDIKPSMDSFFSGWAKKMNDPSTKKALSQWSDTIGRVATSFSNASTSFLSGLTGFFVPILPYAERFANYIERVTASFDEWANGSDGRKSISDFMARAWEDAKRVWDILGQIGGIISKVFMGGDDTGNSFLDGIYNKLKEINDFLGSESGKKKMAEWFADAKEIGNDVGEIAKSIGGIIKNLNSPEGRANAKALMDIIVGISKTAVALSKVADDIGRAISFLVAPATTAALELISSIFGGGLGNRDLGKEAAAGSLQDKLIPGPTIDFGTSLEGTKFTKGTFDKAVGKHLGLTPGQEKELAAYVVPINTDTNLYERTKAIVEQYKFTDKTVPVDGNARAWDLVKGTVAGYAFDAKTVQITANTKPARDSILALKAWLARISLSKGIRVAGVNAPGGITMASGGILTSPTWTHPNVLAGEAGREAYVPLDRPLNQIDPSVRWLAAIAQGKRSMASGGVIGASRSITVAPGAIVVQSPHSDPAMVAEAVLDRLVSFA